MAAQAGREHPRVHAQSDNSLPEARSPGRRGEHVGHAGFCNTGAADAHSDQLRHSDEWNAVAGRWNRNCPWGQASGRGQGVLRVRDDASSDDCSSGFISAHSRAQGHSTRQASRLDSRCDGQDQADAGRSRGDGGASRRVDEILGCEYPEPRKAAVTDAPQARSGKESGTLALEGITRRFGDFTAVDNVSLEIGAGELLALVGASGSGKTTTLRIAAGYEVPDGGRVLLSGNDITRVPPERRGFGMVFQHYALFPHMSVEDNVAFGLEARGVSKVDRLIKARSALANVGLEGAGSRAIQSLSGGEQQRVALARAVVIEPRALLLDEPLSNLDPTLRQAMRDDLRAMLRRVGVPALFVTHDQEDAFAIADRIALLKKGKLLQSGTPEELYHAPASREVAVFIGRGSIVPAEDKGATAAVTIGGVTRDLAETRPKGAASPFESAVVVMLADTLEITRGAGVFAWRGRVTNPRFAGGVVVYRVELAGSDGVTGDVESLSGDAHEDDTVSDSPFKGPVPPVPG